MKKIIILFLALTLSQLKAQITWNGLGTTNDWSESANWSGGVVPQSTDAVVFNGTSTKNCDIDVSAIPDITSLNINSAYTGTIDGLSNPDIYISGVFTMGGGTFIAPIADMGIESNIVFTGGVFSAGSGTVTMWINAGATSSISGSIIFNVLKIASAGGSNTERIMNFGTATTTALYLSTASASKLYSYQGNITILGILNIPGTSIGSPTANTGMFTFGGSGPIAITGSGAAARSKLPNIVVNTTGNVSITGQLNIQGNWTGTQGTLTVGSSTANFYGTSATISGTASAFDNLIIQTGASVTFPAAEVLVGGDFTKSGSVSFPSTSTLSFNGAGTHSITGVLTAQNIRVKSGTINLVDAVTIIESIAVESGATFNTSAAGLTLESNASNTARVAQSAGTYAGSNYTVKTFIPGGNTGWANLGVRGVTGQLVSNWDTYVSSAAANGIPMTCTGCSYGTSIPGGTFCSVQDYDPATISYVELTSSSVINPGIGHWVYVGNSQNTTTGLTLINTGALLTGTTSVAITSGGDASNLVANPYASPISYNELMVINFNNNSNCNTDQSIYVWNADLNGTSGGFSSFNNGATSPGGAGSLTDVIPGGQAFYVVADVGGTLDFDETMKVSNSVVSNPLLKQSAINNQMFRIKIAGGTDWDATLIRINPNAKPGTDKLDAKKIFQSPGYVGYPGPYTKYTTVSTKDANDNDYSINSLPPLNYSISIPLLTKVSASGTYTLSTYDFTNFPMCIAIVDKLTNTYHDLRLTPYIFTISDTTSAPRFNLILCRDEALNTTGINEVAAANGNVQINQDQTGAFVTTKFDKATKATISVYNIMGQQLMKDVIVNATETNTHLNLDLHEQVVLIKVVTDKESTVKKIVLH